MKRKPKYPDTATRLIGLAIMAVLAFPTYIAIYIFWGTLIGYICCGTVIMFLVQFWFHTAKVEVDKIPAKKEEPPEDPMKKTYDNLKETLDNLSS